MKKQPQHRHLPAGKPCFKIHDQLLELRPQRDEDDIVNSSLCTTISQWDGNNTVGAINPRHHHNGGRLTSTVACNEMKKKVSFGGKVRQKTTISLYQYTTEEYVNTWYTPEELETRMQQRILKGTGLAFKTLATKCDPPSTHRRPRYITSKEDAKLMGLTPISVTSKKDQTSSTNSIVLPSSSGNGSSGGHDDDEVNDSSFNPSKDRRRSFIFGRWCRQQKR